MAGGGPCTLLGAGASARLSDLLLNGSGGKAGRGGLLIVALSAMAPSACQMHSQTLKNNSRRR